METKTWSNSRGYLINVVYDISEAFDSNSKMNIIYLQSTLRDLKCIVLISKFIAKIRYGTLIWADLWGTDYWLTKGLFGNWNDAQVKTFLSFGKTQKSHAASSGEYAGWDKEVTFSDFKNCFVSADVCNGTLI